MPIKLKCDYCPQKFISVRYWLQHIELELHARRHLGDLYCNYCGYTDTNFKKVRLHIRRRGCRADSFPKDQCMHCKNFFVSTDNLETHSRRRRCPDIIEFGKWLDNFILDDQLFNNHQAAALDRVFKTVPRL